LEKIQQNDEQTEEIELTRKMIEGKLINIEAELRELPEFKEINAK